MKKRILSAIAAAACLCPSLALAGPYADDLSRCLVSSSTPKDHTLLVQWMFSAVSTAPALQSLSSVTDAQRESYNRAAADLFERLMMKDCRKETVSALKYEGLGAFETGFTVLGQVAGRGMMGDPKAAAQLRQVGEMLDQAEIKRLITEAGLTAK